METQSEFRLLKSGSICEMNGLNATEEAEFIEQMNRLLIEARAALEKQNDDEAYAYIEEFCSYIRMFGNASALYMRYITMEAIAAVTQSGCKMCIRDRPLIDERAKTNAARIVFRAASNYRKTKGRGKALSQYNRPRRRSVFTLR